MKRGFSIATAVVTSFLLAVTALPADGSSLISDKAKKKKKAAPIYYASGQDGLRVPCTIVGTEGKNKLVGTPGDDVICGRGGNDTIIGGGGNDIIDGGKGNDKIDAGAGDDAIMGGTGNDTEIGGLGSDEIYGDVGNDKQIGGSGDDYLSGAKGKDSLFGEDGSDELDGGAGADVVQGGPGSNSCTKDALDKKQFGCFFDNSYPELTEVRIEPSVIDTAVSDQQVNIYLTMHDETGGFAIHSLWGQSMLMLNLRASNGSMPPMAGGFTTFASCVKADRYIRNMSRMPGAYVPKLAACRSGGTKLDPVIRYSYVMPAHSRKGTYEVSNVNFADAAGNSVQYQILSNCAGCYTPPNTKDLASVSAPTGLSFQQIGEGDVTAPTISSVSIPGSVDVSTGDKTIDLYVNASDDFGFSTASFGMSAINANFSLQGSTGFNGMVGGSASGAMCSELQSYQTDWMGCQESPGRFRVKIRVPKSTTNGTYILSNLTAADAVGNSVNFSSPNICQGCLMNDISNLAGGQTLTVFGGGSGGDGVAPTVVNFSMSRSVINTGNNWDYAEAVVTVQEDSGFSGMMTPLSLMFSLDGQQIFGNTPQGNVMMMNGSVMTCTQRNTQMGGTPEAIASSGCLDTSRSSGNTYVFVVPIRVNANRHEGTYKLVGLSISDGTTSKYYSPGTWSSGSPAPGMNTLESLFPGGIPSFYNGAS